MFTKMKLSLGFFYGSSGTFCVLRIYSLAIFVLLNSNSDSISFNLG